MQKSPSVTSTARPYRYNPNADFFSLSVIDLASAAAH